MSDSGIPGIIVDRIASGLRGKMNLTEDQVYSSIQAVYIDGQNPLTIQVIPGPIQTDGGGDGLQTGGALTRRMLIQLTVWYRGKLDMHNRSEQALIEANNGLMDVMEQIRQVLAYTTLGTFPLADDSGNLIADGVNPLLNSDILKYVGESGTSWYDMDTGVLRRDINFSGAWSVVLAEGLTLTNADIRPQHALTVTAPSAGYTSIAIASFDGTEFMTVNYAQFVWTDTNGAQAATGYSTGSLSFTTPFAFPGTLSYSAAAVYFVDGGQTEPDQTQYD